MITISNNAIPSPCLHPGSWNTWTPYCTFITYTSMPFSLDVSCYHVCQQCRWQLAYGGSHLIKMTIKMLLTGVHATKLYLVGSPKVWRAGSRGLQLWSLKSANFSFLSFDLFSFWQPRRLASWVCSCSTSSFSSAWLMWHCCSLVVNRYTGKKPVLFLGRQPTSFGVELHPSTLLQMLCCCEHLDVKHALDAPLFSTYWCQWARGLPGRLKMICVMHLRGTVMTHKPLAAFA